MSCSNPDRDWKNTNSNFKWRCRGRRRRGILKRPNVMQESMIVDIHVLPLQRVCEHRQSFLIPEDKHGKTSHWRSLPKQALHRVCFDHFPQCGKQSKTHVVALHKTEN